MKVQLTCKEVARLISEGQDQSLPPADRARMRLHFVVCETCRNIQEQVGFLRRAMRQVDQPGRAPGAQDPKD